MLDSSSWVLLLQNEHELEDSTSRGIGRGDLLDLGVIGGFMKPSCHVFCMCGTEPS